MKKEDNTHKFTACKFLDYETNYIRCTREMLGIDEGKVFWRRDVSDPSLPSMVQFCTRRGRLNSPEACTCKERAECRDYEDFEHNVPISEINLN